MLQNSESIPFRNLTLHMKQVFPKQDISDISAAHTDRMVMMLAGKLIITLFIGDADFFRDPLFDQECQFTVYRRLIK